MYAALLKRTLERHVVGQTRAVDSLVRSVTLAVSGLPRPSGPLGAFLFMGPSGTGKTHVVRCLARALHGHEERLLVTDARHGTRDDALTSFASQLRPLFRPRARDGVLDAPPLSILLVQGLEGARPEVLRMLASALEVGAVPFDDGTRGNLGHVFVILGSTLCSRQILSEAGRVLGFAPSTDDAAKSERAKIFESCYEEAMRRFEAPLLTRLDDLVVFHPLRRAELREILARHLGELRAFLTTRRVTIAIDEPVIDLVLDRALRTPHSGALALVREFRRHVEFPLADLVSGGGAREEHAVRIVRSETGRTPMTELVVDSVPERAAAAGAPSSTKPSGGLRRIPVEWEEPALVSRR